MKTSAASLIYKYDRTGFPPSLAWFLFSLHSCPPGTIINQQKRQRETKKAGRGKKIEPRRRLLLPTSKLSIPHYKENFIL